MTKVVRLGLWRGRVKIAAKGFKSECSEDTEKFIIKNGFDVNYGARPLGRTIQRSVEDPLSEDILLKKFDPGATIFQLGTILASVAPEQASV